MLINFKSACEELGVKPSTLYQWSEMGLVPVIRVGKLLKYDKEQLLAWFRDGQFQKAKSDVRQGKRINAR